MDKTDNCLALENVGKHFPGFSLRGISFLLPKGYIMGLVGPNGAGKTTTMQLILNMLDKDAGEIRVFGRDHIEDESIIKQDIGVVFDRICYVDSWKVNDTEKAVSIFYDNWRHEIFNEMVDRFKLPRDKRVGAFSRGMQMKLMLACAFSHDAKLLLLDEPTSGLDPVTRSDLLEILQTYISDGERSVLFSTHVTADLERVADYITLLKEGRLIYTGSKDDLLSRYRLIKGRPQDVIGMEDDVIGLRKTDRGFEGLIDTQKTTRYQGQGFVLDSASIDDIVVHISKGA